MIINDNSEILLTTSWGNFTHGISGHLFEIIDYYLILKNHFDVKILIPENMMFFEDIIRDKYNLDNIEIKEIIDNTIFEEKPTLVKSNNIFFVDGAWDNIEKLNIIAKNIICFACGTLSILDHNKDNTHILLDYRVYPKIPKNAVNYKKKLLLGRYRKISNTGEKTLIYATGNCRKLEQYPNIPNLLVIEDKSKPVLNLFDKISAYYYTPTPRHSDCSSRLLVECKYYKKKVILDNEVQKYLDDGDDRGLFYRLQDIENNFESLFLTYDDEIINIIKDIIWK